MKIIFLDIDGVLIKIGRGAERASRSEKEKGGLLTDFNEDLVLNLKHLIFTTNSKMVISSSWRHIEDILKKSWLEAGLDWEDIIGTTPSGLGHGRGNEILTWINNYHTICSNGKHIKNWIAIDDDSADMKSINRLGRFIHTKSNEGLTKDKMKEAILLLNN